MKAEDLMIGDLLRDKYTKEIIEVIELSKDSILFSGDFKGKWQAEPIPLTEETIVDLLGFKPVKYNFHGEVLCASGLYVKNNIEVDFDWNTVKLTNHFKRIRRPKHVHKLQQLI